MPLPHLKQKNNAEPDKFVSVDQEMQHQYRETHAEPRSEKGFLPAHVTPNPELDQEPADADKETD